MHFVLDLYRNDKRVDSIKWNKRMLTIGSSPKCDVVVRHLSVESEQAHLIYDKGRLNIFDNHDSPKLESKSKRASHLALKKGDRFSIHDTDFVVAALVEEQVVKPLEDSNAYTFSPYPSKVQSFNFRGARLGTHFIEKDGKQLVYRARLLVDRVLPECELIQGTLLWTTSFAEQKLDVAHAPSFRARSDAIGFPHELLTLAHEAKDTLVYERLKRRFISILSYTREASSLVCIDLAIDDDKDTIAHAIDFTKVIAKNLLRICDEGRRYMRFAQVSDENISDLKSGDVGIEMLIDELDALGAHLSAHSQRVEQSIETRLNDAEVTQLQGTLHCSFRDGALSAFSLRFFGELPQGPEKAELIRQEKGIKAFFQTWGELVVDDPRIDDAFYINADALAKDLLLSTKRELQIFSAKAAAISIDHRRCSILIPVTRQELKDIVPIIFSFWNQLLRYRLHATPQER